MANRGGDIQQQIILDLQSSGSIDQTIAALLKAKGAIDQLTDSAADSAKVGDALEASTYDVGDAYHVLEADLRRATTAMEKEAVAAQWMARQTRELDEALEGMAASERDAEKAHVSAAAASGKSASATRAAANAAGASGYKWLLLGNAVQDATYGFEAIVNNIPGIVMSFGGSGGLAGGLGIVSVAAGLLIRNLDGIKRALAEKLPTATLDSVDALQEKLKGLEEKQYKTRIDYTDIEITHKKLDALMEAEASYDRLKTGKSKAQQEAGRRATEAMTEYGGGDDFDSSVTKITHAVNEVTDPGVSEPEKKLAQQIADEEKSMDEETDTEAKWAKADHLQRLKQEFETSFATARKNRKAANARRIGRAGLGYGDDTKWLLDLLRSAPEAFANHGVTEGLLPGLSGATRPRVNRDLYEKRQGEIDKALAEAARPEAEAHDADLERQIDENLATGPELGKQGKKRAQVAREHAQRVGPAFDDDFEARIHAHVQAGGKAEDAAPPPGMAEALKARNVPADLADDVAKLIVEKARESALNLVAKGEKPKVVVKEGRDRDKEVTEGVRTYGPGYQDELERGVLKHRAAGESAAETHDKLLPQIMARLEQNGVDNAELRKAIAEKIIKASNDRVSQRIEVTIHTSRVPAPQAAGMLLADADAKAATAGAKLGHGGDAAAYAQRFGAMTQANDAQAMHAGRAIAAAVAEGDDPDVAAGRIYQEMLRHLEGAVQHQPQPQPRQQQARHERPHVNGGGFRSVPPSAEPAGPEAMAPAPAAQAPAAQGDNLAPAVGQVATLVGQAGDRTAMLISAVENLAMVVAVERDRGRQQGMQIAQLMQGARQLRTRRPPLGPMDLGGS